MWLFTILVLAMGLLLLSVLGTITSDRKLPSKTVTKHDRSFRGHIISEDGYTLSRSYKTYKAVIRGESIDPDKKALFIKLFSIYSGIPEKEIAKKFKDKHGHFIKKNIVLSRTLNAKQAMQLKALAYKLRQMKVFRPVKTPSGYDVLYGLDIIEIGESRQFPLHDVLSPVLGYVRKKSDGHYTRPLGQKGLERKYDKHITSKKDGYFRGKRDVGGNLILDRNAIIKPRVDGMDLHLNIPLALQRRIEKMVDAMKQRIDADEIIIGIMESNTGKVRALASSERYDPSHITQSDIPKLDLKFAEYPYEAGSVLKPVTLALALDHHYVTPNTVFNTFNGKMKIGKHRTITDDEKFASLTTTDIIVHSSNVGISQVSWKLTGKEFRDGLIAFGFSKPSGIDLSRELTGRIKPLRLLNNQMHRANSSYGYGMLVTFAQLFKAYSAFNNDGIAVTPRIVDYLEDTKGNHYILPPTEGDLHPVGKKAARQIHEILKEVVARGTGVKAQYPGLEIGGKTGTAHIARHGHYVREYHSSFYGFVNDRKGHKYTIGVLVIRAKKYHKYFASQSAVPTFKNAVRILVEQGYLEPDPTVEVKVAHDAPLYGEKPGEATVSAPILPPLPKEKTPPKVAKEKPQKVIPVPRRKTRPVHRPVKHRPSAVDEATDLF
ncbi:MAG: penicillin-binding protein 2 [Sulfurovum sp.]|nr:penicillin-binding protein 2 [Sulfurovum sp.]